jgi:hypothetical protein
MGHPALVLLHANSRSPFDSSSLTLGVRSGQALHCARLRFASVEMTGFEGLSGMGAGDCQSGWWWLAWVVNREELHE